jgi:hypothetical protein
MPASLNAHFTTELIVHGLHFHLARGLHYEMKLKIKIVAEDYFAAAAFALIYNDIPHALRAREQLHAQLNALSLISYHQARFITSTCMFRLRNSPTTMRNKVKAPVSEREEQCSLQKLPHL